MHQTAHGFDHRITIHGLSLVCPVHRSAHDVYTLIPITTSGSHCPRSRGTVQSADSGQTAPLNTQTHTRYISNSGSCPAPL
jgi:hypothetical protein